MLVQAEEIIYASLADESINIVTGQVAGTSNYRTLDDLQARLDPEVFWRVHRSHLVNINKIKEIVPWFSRNYILRMKDAKGTEIPVSRTQTKRLREYLKLCSAPADRTRRRSRAHRSRRLRPVSPRAHRHRSPYQRHPRSSPASTDKPPSCTSRSKIRPPIALQRLNVWKDELVAWFKTLVSAAVYATLIVTFGFQVARVEGQSMAPTLADQDRLIVNKFAYRMGAPRRGDIVMLYYPLNPDKSFVKRVIAEEGDEVRIVDGRVYVNDVPMPDDFVPPEYRSHDDFGPKRVHDGYYFVMGDHRNNSSDSRHWGMVPKKYIIGRVQLRWWPIPNARVF